MTTGQLILHLSGIMVTEVKEQMNSCYQFSGVTMKHLAFTMVHLNQCASVYMLRAICKLRKLLGCTEHTIYSGMIVQF